MKDELLISNIKLKVERSKSLDVVTLAYERQFCDRFILAIIATGPEGLRTFESKVEAAVGLTFNDIAARYNFWAESCQPPSLDHHQNFHQQITSSSVMGFDYIYDMTYQ